MMDEPIVQFKIKPERRTSLSENENQVLDLLIEAAKLIAPVYSDQEARIIASETQLLETDTPEQPSPYTIIETIDGTVQSIPYHVKYAKLLKPVVEKLVEASNICEEPQFAQFLKLQANALLDGSYEKALAYWFEMKPYPIDICIGPVEHHDERLFYNKASYQAWVGIVDDKATQHLDYYKTVILSVRRKTLEQDKRLENVNHVGAKVLDVFIFSGHMARTKFIGVNIPMNLKLVEKYGSEITLFKQVNELRLKEQIIPTFNKIFSEGFRSGYTAKDIKKGNLDYVAMHELAHNYLYYKNAPKNLQDLLSIIYELAATVLGIKMAGSLLLKDVISNKELESMIVSFICRSFFLKEKSAQAKNWINYATGGVIFVNYLLESGAMRQLNGLTIPNFMKIFVSIEQLFSELEQLLASGTREDAEIFIMKYGKIEIQP